MLPSWRVPRGASAVQNLKKMFSKGNAYMYSCPNFEQLINSRYHLGKTSILNKCLVLLNAYPGIGGGGEKNLFFSFSDTFVFFCYFRILTLTKVGIIAKTDGQILIKFRKVKS